ncbi:MAG: ATP-binding cassette domain-containing protein [Nocardioidaceae bacterium]
MTTTAVLTAQRVALSRAHRRILDDVDLTVLDGEHVAVIGPSGSGKTTLLTLLAGIERPDTGEVLLDDRPLTRPGPEVALVLQGYGLLGLLTASENIEVAMRAAGRTPAEAIQAGEETLRSVGLDGFGSRLVDDLSGGQQQRVAVARALALAPRVLLADEPTAEQDPAHRELVVERLLHPDNASAVVIATHDPEIAARCDRVIELHQGRVLEAPAAG